MAPERCWLRRFSEEPCEGRIIRAHLVDRQLLKRERLAHLIDDPRTWVPACGGMTGLGGHHGAADPMLSARRELVVPRWAIPEELELLMSAVGLSWWLAARYGERPTDTHVRPGADADP